MNFINTTTLEYPVSEAEIRALHPDMLFQYPFSAPDGFAEVMYTEPPEHDPSTEIPREALPVAYDGQWQQAWEIVPMTDEQKTAAIKSRTPAEVARWQARLALMHHEDQEGQPYWDKLQEAVGKIEQPAMRLRMEAALYEVLFWKRDSPAVAWAAAEIQLSDRKVDELFIWAGEQEL